MGAMRPEALHEGPREAGIGQRRDATTASMYCGAPASRYGVASSFGRHCSAPARSRFTYCALPPCIPLWGDPERRSRGPRSGIDQRRRSLVTIMTRSCLKRDRAAQGKPRYIYDTFLSKAGSGSGGRAEYTGKNSPSPQPSPTNGRGSQTKAYSAPKPNIVPPYAVAFQLLRPTSG